MRKTYKLFIGGQFPRGESGRSYPVTGASGQLLANAAAATRKDLRDAVVAARKAFGQWSTATGYNRGQILYRIAEMMEGRRAQFADEVRLAEGGSPESALAATDAAIDRWVWYAGWADKLAQVYGATNAVAGPYTNFTTPEPTGVVGVLAPAGSALLGLVSVVAPVIVSGNTAVVLASQARPLPAITLAEVLATSDLPAGVVNVLTGTVTELAPWLAGHMDVNAVDLSGAPDATLAAEWERAAADNLKRVRRPHPALATGVDRPAAAGAAGEDWTAEPGPDRMLDFMETRTVWYPRGA